MATSPHLSGKLRDALGNDAGDELIGIVDRAASDISELRGDVAELRHEMRVGFSRIEQTMATKAELRAMRDELTDRIAASHADLAGRIAASHADLAGRIAAAQTELAGKLAIGDGDLSGKIAASNTDLSRKIADVNADLMKWSFVFWVGAVASIALLAGVLGN
jgi:hypothetical protein